MKHLKPTHLNRSEYVEVCRRLAEKTDYFEHVKILTYDFCLGNEDGVVLCKIRDFPKGKTLEIVAAVGKNGDANFQDTIETVEEYAKSLDCKHIYIDGRKGWAKALPDYTVSSIILTKTLEENI
jgi:hypothetical protein